MHTNRIKTVNRVANIIEDERRYSRVPHVQSWNVEVGPVSKHEYRSMKDGPLATAAKWSARGLLAVVVTGWLVVVFLMMQN